MEPEMEEDNRSLAVVILAAGKGKRMKSSVPKVLHRVCGRNIIEYVLDAVRSLEPAEVVAVVGHGAEAVRKAVGGDARCVEQAEQLGTGHAVMTAMKGLASFDEILVLPGDSPLVTGETLGELLAERRRTGASAAILAVELADPTGYGRIVRNISGGVARIVEEADATDLVRAVGEVNACTYAFDRARLEPALAALTTDNAQGEYYLTDVIEFLVEKGGRVVPVRGAPEEALGINDREQLAYVESLMRKRINRHLMLDGVTLCDPDRTYIDFGVGVGRDTVVLPLVFVSGNTVIGRECRIGPSTTINDSRIGDRTEVEFSWLDGCEVAEDVKIGPYSRLRPGCSIGPGAKVGSFVEMKKTVVGRGSKVPHLSYMGDASIGEDVNVGAGSITCNYDGKDKHPTRIGDRAFLGSDTMLVAPVEIGEDAVTAAGSSITKDVPPGHLGIERSEQKNIPDWHEKKRKDHREEKPLEDD